MRIAIKFGMVFNRHAHIEINLKNEKTGEVELEEMFWFDRPEDAVTALVMGIKIIDFIGAKESDAK